MNLHDFDLAGRIAIKELEDRGKLPLFLALSGSHASGLATEKSDIDIRGIYLDSTKQILSLHRGSDTVEATVKSCELGADIDMQFYELEKGFNMLLNNNGNIVRLLFSPIVLYKHIEANWDDLRMKFLTKKLRHYYRGYAQAQQKRAMSERGGKALVYTYREIFEGLSVMVRGTCPIWDFLKLWEWVKDKGFYEKGLLDEYFGHPEKKVTDEGWRRFYAEWEELCLILDSETAKSTLPDSCDGFEELNQLLLGWRLQEGLSVWRDGHGLQRKRLNV